ncbi:MAG: hypothetical protein KDB88_05635 [Flavobacteriales bacterium]|nr:hypothetical protein [Flavobacteriales bacterium]
MAISTKQLLVVSALALLCVESSAQFRFNAFGGYTFQDRFNLGGSYLGYQYQEGRVKDAPHFGGGFEFMTGKNTAIELYGQYQPTEGYLRTTFLEYGPYEVNATYIMLGGMRYQPFSPAVSGYGGLSIGMAIMGGDGSSTKLAWGGKLGIMVNASETVGIKLGGQLLSPIQGAGGGLYFGTGGASAGVSTYSTIYQFGFTGGLSIAFGGKAPGGRPGPPPPPAPPGGGMN